MSTTLSGTMVAGGTVSTQDLDVTSDDEQLVYLADQDTAGTVESYNVSIDNQADSTRINPDLPADGDALKFMLLN